MRPALRPLKSLNTSSAARPSICSLANTGGDSGENVWEVEEKETQQPKIGFLFYFPSLSAELCILDSERERERGRLYIEREEREP